MKLARAWCIFSMLTYRLILLDDSLAIYSCKYSCMHANMRYRHWVLRVARLATLENIIQEQLPSLFLVFVSHYYSVCLDHRYDRQSCPVGFLWSARSRTFWCWGVEATVVGGIELALIQLWIRPVATAPSNAIAVIQDQRQILFLFDQFK